MAASNINSVVITGNLTKDPELRSTGGGTSVCEMRVAVNSRRKDQSGQWVDKPNFFDVVVFGGMADTAAQYLSRGRPLAVEGRLDFQEWEAKEGGGKRSKVVIIANSVQFLNSREDNGQGGQAQGGGSDYNAGYANQGGGGGGFDATPPPGGGGAQEDDIPF